MQHELTAAEVFAMIEEPTAQMGRIATLLHRLTAPFGGQLVYPGGTHPVVVEKATGKRAKGSTPAAAAMIEDMQADLGTMSAQEFRSRYFVDL